MDDVIAASSARTLIRRAAGVTLSFIRIDVLNNSNDSGNPFNKDWTYNMSINWATVISTGINDFKCSQQIVISATYFGTVNPFETKDINFVTPRLIAD